MGVLARVEDVMVAGVKASAAVEEERLEEGGMGWEQPAVEAESAVAATAVAAAEEEVPVVGALAVVERGVVPRAWVKAVAVRAEVVMGAEATAVVSTEEVREDLPVVEAKVVAMGAAVRAEEMAAVVGAAVMEGAAWVGEMAVGWPEGAEVATGLG